MEEKERRKHTYIRKRKLDSSLWNVSVCVLWVCVGCLGDSSVAWEIASNAFLWVCVSVAYGRLVGSLWNVSVCFLWVCVGCLGDWSVACGMCRYAFYGCVSVASEIGW